MEFDSDKMNFMFKNIAYDTSKLKEDFIRRDVPDKEFLMGFFYPYL